MYRVPQKSKCVPGKAGCQPWLCGVLGKFQQFRLEHVWWESKGWECPGLQQAENAGPCQQGHQGQSQCCCGKAALVLCSIPQLCRAGGKWKFLPGETFQVSSAGSWKSISASALQGARSDRQQRQGEQQIMLLKRTINSLLVVKEKAIKTENK